MPASASYGIGNYNDYVKTALAKLTAADVNAAIKRQLRSDNMQIVGVARDTAKLQAELTGDVPTPMHYNTPKAQDILDEDKTVENWPLKLRPENVKIIPVSQIFEN